MFDIPAAIAILTALALQSYATAEPVRDLAMLQGTWLLVALKTDGKEHVNLTDQHKLLIENDQFRYQLFAPYGRMTITVDPMRSPKVMRFRCDLGDRPSYRSLRYEVTQSELTIATEDGSEYFRFRRDLENKK